MKENLICAKVAVAGTQSPGMLRGEACVPERGLAAGSVVWGMTCDTRDLSLCLKQAQGP